MRWRTPENVIEELEHLKEKFGLIEFLFVDDNFTYDKNRVIDLCRSIRKEGLDVEWYTEGRVDHADDQIFQEMESAGCKLFVFGIESCVEKILRYYRKGITYGMAQDAVKNARKARLTIGGNFILGAPIETVDDMWETVRKAAKLDLDFASFYILQIYRGTPLWTELAQQGSIDDNSRWEDTISGFEINPEITLENGNKLMKEFHTFFYTRKFYQLKQTLRFLLHRRKQISLNQRHPLRVLKQLIRSIHIEEN